MPRVLIVAAGGRVARRVAAGLCARGEPPRALVRDAGKAREVLIDHEGAVLPLEMVVSDFADRDGLRRALVGIEIAFLALGSSLQQVELEQRFIDVASEAGLPHLVKLSAASPSTDSAALVLRWHAAIESHLVASGIPHTLLSPSTFADVLMLAAPTIRTTDHWSGSAPRGRNALIDSADVVDAAIAVLSEPSKRGMRHVLTGPVGLTWPEVAARLTRLLGRPIHYDPVPVEERRAQLEAGGLAPWRIDLLLGLDEINRSDLYATPTDTVRQLTSHPPRTVEEYIERNRAAFS
ncbi:MAG TPA: NmrA family NAD(P)-binding protein [Burkholderiales bacterium]|nr:NmrA family NAD(P)-binding protein [Burkholderiales bacterium]